MVEVMFKYADGSLYHICDNGLRDVATPGKGQKLLRLIESVTQDGWPQMDPWERASFVAINSRICRKCGCSENNPCIAPEGNCHWVEADLCSTCQARIPGVRRPYSL